MNDYDSHNLHSLWDNYIVKYDLHKLNINLVETPYQDIKYVKSKILMQ